MKFSIILSIFLNLILFTSCSEDNLEVSEEQSIISKIVTLDESKFIRRSEIIEDNFNHKLWSSTNQDLNGDGKDDIIIVEAKKDFLKNEKEPNEHSLLLNINGRSFQKKVNWSLGSHFGEDLEFQIIDIDKRDTFKEFAISYAEAETEDPSKNHTIIRILKSGQITVTDIFSEGYSNGQIRFLDGAIEVVHGRYPDKIGTYALNEKYVEQIDFYEQDESEVDYSGIAACPFVYSVEGNSTRLQGEILRYLNVDYTEKWQRLILNVGQIKSNILHLRISEEKDEVTYVNALYLKVGSRILKPIKDKTFEKICSDDKSYFTLKKGEYFDVKFDTRGIELKDVSLHMKGYYLPIIEKQIHLKK